MVLAVGQPLEIKTRKYDSGRIVCFVDGQDVVICCDCKIGISRRSCIENFRHGPILAFIVAESDCQPFSAGRIGRGRKQYPVTLELRLLRKANESSLTRGFRQSFVELDW